MSLVILAVLILGILAGMGMPVEISGWIDQASSYLLLILLVSVGIDMGRNREVFLRIRELGMRILLIPFGVVAGSLCGGMVAALLLRMPLREGMAITAGLGWYSLSGILMTEAGNPMGGALSFLSNVFREVLTFLLVPVLAGQGGFYAAIAPAGATAMDTTLGLISKHTNGTVAVIAFVSGVVCTLAVPFLVPLFC